MLRVYVAGSYSADNTIDLLDNIRRGLREGTKVLLAGFAPFVPWTDFLLHFMLKEGENLTTVGYYTYSIQWLKVSDVMYVIPDSDESVGTQMEITYAKEQVIPIYYSLETLKMVYKEEVNK